MLSNNIIFLFVGIMVIITIFALYSVYKINKNWGEE